MAAACHGVAAADAVKTRGQSVKVEAVEEWSDFLKLEESWNCLLEESPQRDNIFLRHEWFKVWWEAFGKDKRLLVLMAFEGNRLVGIAPLMEHEIRHFSSTLRLVSFICNDHTNRAELIVAPDGNRQTLRAFWEVLKERKSRWDILSLEYLPVGVTATSLEQLFGADGWRWGLKQSYHSPYIPIQADWEKYYGELKGHFKRNLKNREKRFNSLGQVTYETYPSEGKELKPFLERIFTVGAKSWKEERSTAIASTQTLESFYGRLAQEAERKGWLSLHLLSLDDRPVAFHYSLKYRDRLFLLKTEYDLDYAPFSPGHLIQKRVLEEAFKERLTEFEFLGEWMPWKQEWTVRVKPHVRLFCFNQGWRPYSVYLEKFWIKPMIKRLLHLKEN